MKTKQFRSFICLITAVVFSAALSARAHVCATDIKVNGSLSTITNAGPNPVTISYRLNQAATLGVTVAILQGTSLVATFSGGTNRGLNTVVWGGTNNSGSPAGSGIYSINVTAAASGFTNWNQISVDANAGNYSFYVGGLAVDNNTNSPYYGRVVLGCGSANGAATNPVSGEVIRDGIYKMNADGSFADEGGFGYGGYTNDDFGNLATNQMPSSGRVPWRLRIGDDDRIYMLDWSAAGAIVSFDMQVTGYKIVIDDGGFFGGTLGGPHNYAGNPDINDLSYGIINFDVTATTTTNAAIWLCDADPLNNWGIWMYHLVDGQSDTNDAGSQAVTAGGDLTSGSSGGCSVDANLDIFCGQSLRSEYAVYYGMAFTNWNAGALPPISSGSTYAAGAAVGEVGWGYGCGVNSTCSNNPTFESLRDVVINSRTSPTIVAFPMGPGADATNGSGIRLLNALNGTTVETNLDFGQEYESVAWDNVGNLYGASASRSVWRAWSPPGSSTNTTVAVAQVIVLPVSLRIDAISAVRTSSGSANINLLFSAAGNSAPSAFTLLTSPTVNGTYAAISGVVITGSSGAYQANFSSSSTSFYKIKQTGP